MQNKEEHASSTAKDTFSIHFRYDKTNTLYGFKWLQALTAHFYKRTMKLNEIKRNGNEFFNRSTIYRFAHPYFF